MTTSASAYRFLSVAIAGVLVLSFGCSKKEKGEQTACENGDAEACISAGEKKSSAGDKEGYFRLIKKACDLGNNGGCHLVALSTVEGIGTNPDPKTGAAMLEKLCDSGYMRSCYMRGLMIHSGKFAESDPDRAVQLFMKSCNGGFADACYWLGKIAVGIDDDEMILSGLKYMKEGCKKGSKDACAYLDELHSDTPSDEATGGGVEEPVEFRAEGIKWIVSGDLVDRIKIKKVTCERTSRKKYCKLTVKVPQGWDREDGPVSLFAYDDDDVMIQTMPVSPNLRRADPGGAVRVNFPAPKETKRAIIRMK